DFNYVDRCRKNKAVNSPQPYRFYTNSQSDGAAPQPKQWLNDFASKRLSGNFSSTRAGVSPAVFGVREPHNDLQPGIVIASVQCDAVQVSHRLDQAEPEPIARRRPALLRPVEALENALALLDGHARPFVGDGGDDALTIPAE